LPFNFEREKDEHETIFAVEVKEEEVNDYLFDFRGEKV
jgi:hypothetical protein